MRQGKSESDGQSLYVYTKVDHENKSLRANH